MPPAHPLIQLRNVRKVYRTSALETTALDDVSLDIDAGEFVAVMGPSGCGKSTLLNVVGMVDVPTSGHYELAGVRVSAAAESDLAQMRRGNIGYIFQSFHLIDHLPVYQNVELPLLYLGATRQQRRRRVREVLELVGLMPRARHLPAELSGGQQQRVAIARAVVGDPKLIVADEPTGNLDTRNGEEVMEMLGVLNEQGATILMVTHSPDQARRAGRILHMLDGRLVPGPQ